MCNHYVNSHCDVICWSHEINLDDNLHVWLILEPLLTHPLTLSSGTSMVPNQPKSNLDLLILFYPTLKVEQLNPTKSFGISNVVPTTLSIHLH